MRQSIPMSAAGETRHQASAMRYGWVWLALAGITLLGLTLRLYRLGEVPTGMHPDEAHYALDAVEIMRGWRPVFLPGNNGREPLFVYFMAGLFSLIGPSVWSARLAGAVVGTLMIPVQYLLVSRLPLPRPHVTALISASLVAFTFWPVSQSHQALRAGLFPAQAALVLWAIWETLREPPPGASRSRPWWWAMLTGVLLAAALWTHLSARLLPPVLMGFGLWMAWRRRTWQPLWLMVASLALAAVLVIPLALYFVENPDMLGFRANQVSVLNPEVNKGDLVGTLVENARLIALMVNVRGTTSWLENLRGRPVFDPLIGVAFLAGLALLLRDLIGRRGASAQSAAVLLWLGWLAMLAPSWLSAGAPSYGRLNGAWAALFLLPAWGLERGVAWLSERGRARLGTALAVGVLCISAAWSAYDFFVVYAQAPEVYAVYTGPVLEAGKTLANLTAQGPTYTTPDVWNHSVIRLSTVQHPPGVFDPRQGLVLPLTGDALYTFTPAEAEVVEEVSRRWPSSQRQDYANSQGTPLLLTLRLPRVTWPTPPVAVSLPNFGGHIQLEAYGAGTAARGKPLALTLQWLALTPTPLDNNLFIRVVATDGREIGKFDGPPLGGSYGTQVWRPGERVWQIFQIPIAANAPTGAATIRLGWYDWRDGTRLAVEGDDDNAVEIGRVEIRE